MADPVSNKVQVTGYTGVQAGIIKSPSDNAYLNSGATLGGQVSYKGTFLRGQVEAGTALGGKVELGHTFDIGRNMGLELSVKAQESSSLLSKGSAKATIENDNIASMEEAIHDINALREEVLTSGNGTITSDLRQYVIDSEWDIRDKRLGAQAKLTFGTSKAKFSVGVEGGIRADGRPNVNYNLSTSRKIENYISKDTSIVQDFSFNSSGILSENKKGGYVTPTVSADVKLNKHLSLNINADLYQGQAGIRYNF